jgi:hypothetical protein
MNNEERTTENEQPASPPTPGYLHHDREKHSPHVAITHDLDLLPWRVMYRRRSLQAFIPLAGAMLFYAWARRAWA